MALIKLEGENSTTTRKLVERFDYKDNTIRHVKFESAGIVGRDCERSFTLALQRYPSISLEVNTPQLKPFIYKVLELLSRAQRSNERLWEISSLGMKYASEASWLGKKSGQVLTKQSDEATGWLYDAYKCTHPHCYREVIRTTFLDLHLVCSIGKLAESATGVPMSQSYLNTRNSSLWSSDA